MCAYWHVCVPTWVWMHPMSVSMQHVCLSATYTACGSYTRLCEDSAGSSVSLVFARSSFPPTVGRQAGRLGWLWGWHSLDDLGRKEGRHTAIHGHIMHMKNRKALVVQRYSLISLFDQRRNVLIGLQHKITWVSLQMHKNVHIFTNFRVVWNVVCIF